MMKQGLVLAVLCFFALYECRTVTNHGKQTEVTSDPDMFRNVSELITSKGYPEEDHYVQTADGYILSMQRIPHGINGDSKGKQQKKVVFLQHGLMSAASDWVINYPNQSLGFILADAGYDVWLGNNRGNTYSRRHVKYTIDQMQFWNYSFDQMGQYDLPAMIDYVLQATGQKQLYYVGHSQGTTQAFALLSENPEYNKKIKLFIALAPVTTVGHISSPIKYIAPFANDINYLFDLLGVKDLLPSNSFMRILSELVCETQVKFICEDIVFMLFGVDKAELNQTRLAVYSAHTPAGSSTKSVVHFAQLVNSKKFQKYDYDRDNMEHYHQKTPPEYDVSLITTPTALIWSLNDKLADPVDVDLLQGKLKSSIFSHCVSFPNFNHMDYVMGLHARKYVYEDVLKLLSKH